MSSKKGIKLFGTETVNALIKEYQQLDDHKVLTPIKSKALTYEQKRNLSNAKDLIKQKCCGKIKRRTVADRC